jgi:hypothetical protein
MKGVTDEHENDTVTNGSRTYGDPFSQRRTRNTLSTQTWIPNLNKKAKGDDAFDISNVETRSEKIPNTLKTSESNNMKLNQILGVSRGGRSVPYDDILHLAQVVSNHGLSHNPQLNSRDTIMIVSQSGGCGRTWK